ncbi:MAG: hypothetical protein JXN62_02530 [Bacteroidales bacterium]|nr:hypothetical protein [Bacteroidales bacterium]
MKKLIFTLAASLLVIATINAQSLEEIVSKYTTANKLDKIAGFKTLKITGNVSVMGMEMPVELWMKNPDKIKMVTNMSGQETIQVFDGKKGYIINAMTGSSEAVEMSADQVKEFRRNNLFQNALANYLKDGQLTLAGEENVNGKPAYKVKASLAAGASATVFIDKSSFLILKTVSDINQGGMSVTAEAIPSDYTDFNGILVPMKTTTSVSGMEMVTSFTKVEVDVPIDDSVFEVK